MPQCTRARIHIQYTRTYTYISTQYTHARTLSPPELPFFDSIYSKHNPGGGVTSVPPCDLLYFIRFILPNDSIGPPWIQWGPDLGDCYNCYGVTDTAVRHSRTQTQTPLDNTRHTHWRPRGPTLKLTFICLSITLWTAACVTYIGHYLIVWFVLTTYSVEQCAILNKKLGVWFQ